jgi:hypothetical protein
VTLAREALSSQHQTAELDDAALLRSPGGVDPVWYHLTYPDIGPHVDPTEHFAEFGWRERRSPTEGFSTDWYLQIEGSHRGRLGG